MCQIIHKILALAAKPSEAWFGNVAGREAEAVKGGPLSFRAKQWCADKLNNQL